MGAIKHLAMDFPAEYAAFTLAMAFSTQIHASNTPTYARDFIDQNASVAGVASFAGFIAASRASHAVLQSFGVAYDPRRAGLDYRVQTPFRPGQVVPVSVINADGSRGFRSFEIPGRDAWEDSRVIAQPKPPTRFQRNFAPLLGPIGLSAGMVVSSAMHELMADPNLRICAKGTYFPDKTSEKEKAEAQAKVDAACDQFWEDFALSKKAADYTPDVLAMASASLIDAYVFKKGIIGGTKWATKKSFGKAIEKSGVVLGKSVVTGGLEARAIRAGSEKYIPWILRGLRTGAYIGSIGTGPVGKFAMTVGNIFVFMEIVHPITPLIKKPFERSRQGNDVTKRISEVLYEIDRAEKNKWSWMPRPDSDFCNLSTGYETDALGTPTPYSTCFVPEQPAPDFLLKKMAERQAKWREFVLQDAYLSHTSWQSYVARFATMYANATAFYQQVVSHINYERFDDRAKGDQSYLFAADPFNGLYTDPSQQRDVVESIKAVAQARAWLETYLEGQRLKARNSKFRVHSTERDSLPKILTGLQALDANVSLVSLGAPEARFRNLNGMNAAQKKEFETRVRERLLSEAIRELRRVLATDIVYTDSNIPFGSPMYLRMAETNPFMAVRMRLGDPRPLSLGRGFINAANDDESVIGQDFKTNHPSGIGRARANSMTEYLMLSMVCGPEADPRFSPGQKVQIYRERKLSMFERALEMFGLGGKPISADSGDVLIAVKSHISETTGTDRSGLIPKFKDNAIITEWAGYQAEFRPPRIVDGISPEICRSFAANSNQDKSMYDPFEAKWTIGGVTYNGIVDIVTKKVRAEIVGSALPPATVDKNWKSPFDIWWTDKVDKHVIESVAKFRADYRKILKEKYIPALTQTGVDSVKVYNGRPFKLGAFEALYDEATLYMLILGKTSKVTEDAATRKSFDTLTTSVLLEFKNVAGIIADLEFVEQKGAIASAAYEMKRKELESRLGDLQAFVEKRQGSTKATPDVLKINQQAMKNMTGLLGEMDSYWGVIRGIQVEGL